MDFWLCGQFRMRGADQVRNLGTTLLHEILAMLVLRANSAVAVVDIVGNVWPAPGQAGEDAVRPYISRIRKMLAGLDCRLTTLPRRYILEIDSMRVDVLRFNRLLAQAGTRDVELRRRSIEEALRVCPSESLLSGFTRSWVHAARDEHRARWRDAAVRRNTFWLADGDAERVLDFLRAEPALLNDQRLARDYLEALRDSGQVAEALRFYRGLGQRLATARTPMLRKLQELGEQLLRPDPVVGPDQPYVVAETAADLLPPRTVELAGRSEQIAELRRHAADRQVVRIIGIYGPAGIGKTSLATAFAHEHKQQYPGGVLFAQIGAGADPGPADIDAVLESFLRALGVAADRIPADRAARLQRYRDLTRRRAMLVVLDNAGSAADAAALVPAGPGSLVIVTSRRRMLELTAKHGARAIILEPIGLQASIDVLTRLAGGRPDWSPAVAAEVAMASRGHPLVLSLAGARLATRPQEPPADVVTALTEPGQRLGALAEWAESDAAVTDVIRWSYDALDEPAARAFRLFGLSPCPTLDLASLARLADRPEVETRPLVSTLLAAELVHEVRPRRYQMLDLVAEFARARAVLIDPREVAAALDRLYAHQRASTRAAVHVLWPDEVPAAAAGYRVERKEEARAWLAEHRDDLLHAACHPSAASWPEHVIDLANSLFRPLDHGGYLGQAVALHEAAIAAARRLGDERAHARMLGRLGAVLIRRGETDRAITTLRRARELCASLADRFGEAVALGNLGRIAYHREALDEALACQTEALRLFQESGDGLAQIRTLTNLGLVYHRLDRPDEALRVLESAHGLCSGVQATDAVARVNGTIAGILREQGRWGEAQRRYEKAVDDFRQLGDRIGEATTLTRLGLVRSDQGHHAEAARLHEQALTIFTEASDELAAIDTLINLGHALRALGQHLPAVRRHREAYDRAAAVGSEGQRAAVHLALAEDYAALADQPGAPGGEALDALALARQHLAQARQGFRGLGKPVPAAVAGLAQRLGET